MKRYVKYFISAALLVVLVSGKGNITRGLDATPPEEGPSQERRAQGGGLLKNANMEEGFYWEYPNHFVAKNWTRWWLGDVIPEYDDVRDWRPYRYDGDHAQIYFWSWPVAYTAGIYQRVAVQPCRFYQFSMYGRNHSDSGVNHHARLGIDPLGRIVDDPYIDYFPPEFVWSPEQTFLYTWGLHTVTAESRSDYITAITYVSPDRNHPPYDTFWDAGSLVEVAPPDGRLPEPSNWNPDGFITNVISHTASGQLTIEWDTAEPVLTQVWYSVHTPTSPTTPTITLSHTLYLPLVSRWEIPDLYTSVDQSDATHHEATIEGLEKGQTVEFVILARRLVEYSCLTMVSDFFTVVAE